MSLGEHALFTSIRSFLCSRGVSSSCVSVGNLGDLRATTVTSLHCGHIHAAPCGPVLSRESEPSSHARRRLPVLMPDVRHPEAVKNKQTPKQTISWDGEILSPPPNLGGKEMSVAVSLSVKKRTFKRLPFLGGRWSEKRSRGR